MTELESNGWQTDMVKHGKDPSSPQLLLLTTDYPSSSNQQILKDISSESDLTSQSQLLLDQVGSLSPFSKEFLSQAGSKEKNEPLNSLLVLKADESSGRTTEAGTDFGDVTLSAISKNSSDEHFSPHPSLDNIPDDISSPQENTFRSTSMIFEPTSLNDFECADKDGISEGLERDELGTCQSSDLACRIRDDDNLNIHEEINLPNALCSVGWGTDSEEEPDDEICQVIQDRPVLCRAKATLPICFLSFGDISKSKDIGVFATRPLPKRCQFGPMDGTTEEDREPGYWRNEPLLLSIQKEDQFVVLNISNEELSNWMRYVRVAKSSSEQNLSLVQRRNALYFITCRPVKQGDELKVWYSLSYASARFLPLLSALEGTKWKCSVCNFKCASSSSIAEHMENHKNLKKQALLEVHKRKMNQSKSNQGKNNHKNEKKRLYPRQDSTESSHSSSQDGFNSGGREWWCSHCSLCFNTATTLNFHMLAHAADDLEAGAGPPCDHCHISHDQYVECVGQENKLLNCNMCTRFFTNTASLACHIKSHSSEKKYECPICCKVFPKILELKTHIHSHAKNGIFTCNVCAKEFKTYKYIRKHIRAFHSEKIYSCEECKKQFSTADKLKTHKLTHTCDYQYLCANCGKQFKRKDKLGEHMRRIHSADGKKPLQNRMSKQHLVKARERLIHYVYKCQICVIGFKRRGMLVNHMANRHPDLSLDAVPALNLPILKPTKDYYCQYCDKIYKSNSKRKAHILKCHPGAKLPVSNRKLRSSKKFGDDGNPNDNSTAGTDDATYSQTVGSITTDPHGCQWCHKQYASKAKLLQHQRNKHGSLLLMQDQSSSSKTSSVPNQVRSVIVNSLDSDKSGGSGRVPETKTALPYTLIPLSGEYELSEIDGYFISEGEFIVDAPTLRRALKGELSAELGTDLSNFEALLSQSRPDQYFKVTQTAEGLTIAQPLEVWDNVYSPLSPSITTVPPR